MKSIDPILYHVAKEFQSTVPVCLTNEIFRVLFDEKSFGLFIWDLSECLAHEMKISGVQHFRGFFEVLEKYIDYNYLGIGIDLQVNFLKGFALYLDKSIWDEAPQFAIFNNKDIEVIMQLMGKKTRFYLLYYLTK